MIAFLNELIGHLRRNKAPYTLGALGCLLTSLFLVVWRRWLYAFLAQRGQAVPREALGALIGVLIIFLLASVLLAVHYARVLKALQANGEPISGLPVTVGLKQALAQLRAFSDNLPQKGDIEEKFVTEYHGILTRIEKETDHNLDNFRIATDEVDHRDILIPGGIVPSYSGRRRPSSMGPSVKRYCNREVFLIRLHGVINFLK